MKKILSLILLTVSCIMISFADNNMLVVLQKNGNVMSYILSSNPNIAFGDSILKIRTETTTSSVEISVGDIEKFYFSEAPSLIEKTTRNEVRFVRTANDELLVLGIDSNNVKIKACDISGKQVSVKYASVANGIVLSLALCPQNIYILKINNLQPIKFIKK